MVAVENKTAKGTGMDTNGEVFRNSSSTSGTELRGIFGRNLNYGATSLRRFITQYIKESKPSYIPHLPSEAMAKAIPRVHVLNIDSIISGNKPVGSLEMEISPLVIDLFVGLSDKDSGLTSTVRAFNSPGEPLLSHSQHSLRPLKEAWVPNLTPFRSSQKRLTTDIYTDHLTCLGERPIGNIIAGERSKPLPCGSSPNSDGLNVPFDRTGEAELECADIPDSEVFHIQLPTCLLQSERVIPILAFESGKASFAVTLPNPSEEASKGFVQFLKHILKNLRTYLSIFGKGILQLRELLNLVKAGDRAFVLFVDDDTLLKGSIVEAPAQVEPIFSLLESMRTRLNAILKSLFHLPCTVFSIAQFKKGDKPYRASPSVSPL